MLPSNVHVAGVPTTNSIPLPFTARTFSWICGALLLAMAALPLVVGWSGGAHLWILALGLLGGAVLTLAQPAPWRAPFWTLFLLGLTTRVVLHAGVFTWARAADGPFLSPDATLYFGQSLQLAMQDLRLPLPPYVYFGTFDCAHYYLFGAAHWLWGADLFGLQVLNIVLSSVVGPLTYAIARRVEVPYAFAVGVVVALYPSLIALSINDLMKDASVIGFFLIGAWAIVELWLGDPSTRRRVLLVAVAVLTLSYVRMSRFYVPAFLEAGTVAAVAALGLNALRGQPVSMSRVAVLSVATSLVLVELIPMRLGWPSSPVMVWQAINHSLETPEMRLSAVGMVDRMQAGGQVGPRHGGDLTGTGNLSTRAGDIVAQVARASGTNRSATVFLQPTRPLPPAAAAVALQGPPPTLARRVVLTGANLVRKVFGPFPWVMPPMWDARLILTGDYLMFPGMIIWYMLLPLALAGLVLVPFHALTRPHVPTVFLALATFVSILFVQFLALNLSYRQREFMFPFLALCAAFAVAQRPATKWPAYGYAAYLGGIVLLAGVHIALRARIN